MKTTKFFALALAVLALGACSSDDVIGQKEPAITGGEKGYVSISVNMPTQPTGRAFDETLDDGLPSEYKVNDATLLLFSGATEDGATFASAYNLDATGFAMNGGSTDQITSNATLVQEVTVPTTTDDGNIYALVVLNNNGKIDLVVSVNSYAGLGSGIKTRCAVYLYPLDTTMVNAKPNYQE